jgi:ABC-type bacteriocin/lantibiotic exporter with double-glycine peptidase domain
LLWIEASSVMQAQMSPGQLIVLFHGLSDRPANSLLSIVVSALSVLAADRLFEIMDLESEKNSGTIVLDNISPLEIRFENVVWPIPADRLF